MKPTGLVFRTTIVNYGSFEHRMGKSGAAAVREKKTLGSRWEEQIHTKIWCWEACPGQSQEWVLGSQPCLQWVFMGLLVNEYVRYHRFAAARDCGLTQGNTGDIMILIPT